MVNENKLSILIKTKSLAVDKAEQNDIVASIILQTYDRVISFARDSYGWELPSLTKS